MKVIVNTAVSVPVNAVPLADSTNPATIEDAVAYNATGLALQWNFVTTAGVVTQTAVTPTTSGDYDWSHLGGGMYKIEIPASGGASINNTATGSGYFTGSATGVLPFRGPTIEFVSANVANSVVNGTDLIQVDVTQVNGAGQTIATQSSVDDVKTVVDQIAGSTVAATGTVQDLSASTTVFKTSLTQADDFWNDATITFTSGALDGQTKPILDFAQTNGAITLDEPTTSAPSNGVTFNLNVDHTHPVSQIQSGLATSASISNLSGRIPAALTSDGAIVADAKYVNGTGQSNGDLNLKIDAIPTAIENRQEMDANSTQLALIVADTNEIQAELADGGRIDLLIDAILADTDSLDTTKITTARADVLTDWINGGRLDLILDTIATDTTTDIPSLITALGTPAQAGDQMDLIDTPNATAIDAFVLAVLKRDWTGITGEAARSMLNALRHIRNKWSVSGSTLTVTKEDDSTAAWTSTISTDAAADPITGSDPA